MWPGSSWPRTAPAIRRAGPTHVRGSYSTFSGSSSGRPLPGAPPGLWAQPPTSRSDHVSARKRSVRPGHDAQPYAGGTRTGRDVCVGKCPAYTVVVQSPSQLKVISFATGRPITEYKHLVAHHRGQSVNVNVNFPGSISSGRPMVGDISSPASAMARFSAGVRQSLAVSSDHVLSDLQTHLHAGKVECRWWRHPPRCTHSFQDGAEEALGCRGSGWRSPAAPPFRRDPSAW